MKKLISILLMLLMTLRLMPVYAYSPQFEYEAKVLYDLELFKGTENGFELDGICDRLQGATMFVRLLGEEKEATSNPKSHPFNDVADSWASPYVGQMYNQGYTKGSSATEYGAGKMTANQFATFCLRALDYKDGVDFTVDTALNKMLELHIIREDTYNLIANDANFYRDYAVKLAYNTLAAEYKERRTLPYIEQTIKDFYAGMISEEEVISRLDAMDLNDLWEIYYVKNGYDFSKPSYLKFFLDKANEYKEILLLQLFRDGVVSRENLKKNIFWIENDMYLYTIADLYDSYLEQPIKEYRSTVTEKAELGLGDILERGSAVTCKAWEAYDDRTYCSTTNPFDLSTPSFDPSPYAVYRIEYGPMRKCEYYLKGTHEVELNETEKYIVNFVQKEFLDKITDDMSAYDKVMAANDFLRNNVKYDRNFYPYMSASFIPLFTEGKASCSGFAQVFQFLMKLVDIECYVVDLDMKNNPSFEENHAWNIVRLDDGKLYHVDTSNTDDDPFCPLTASTVEHADYEPIYVIEPVFGDPKEIKR